MANTDPISILTEALQEAASSDEMPIVHFERRGDTFRVWPRDNGMPFTVALVGERDELVELLTKQAREGDEAAGALASVRALCASRKRHGAPSVSIERIERALDGSGGAS